MKAEFHGGHVIALSFLMFIAGKSKPLSER